MTELLQGGRGEGTGLGYLEVLQQRTGSWEHQKIYVVVLQLLSHVWLFATPWTAASQPSLFFTISWSLLKLISIDSVMPSNHLILSHPLLLLPSIFPNIRVFSDESALCIRWPKYWSFSLCILPMTIQEWFPLGLTSLISLQSKGLSPESSPTLQFKSTKSIFSQRIYLFQCLQWWPL